MATRRLDWGSVTKTILLHLVFWIVTATYFAWEFGSNSGIKGSIINAAFYLPGLAIMVYPLLYFLVPKFLLTRKFLRFMIGLIITLSLCSLYTVLAQLMVNDAISFRGITSSMGRNVLPFLHIAGLALSIKLLIYWYQQKKQIIEAEDQRKEAELQLLKAQFHPHFLFNTLNNLYSYSLEASPKSPEIVMKLSELLRFMIYESNSPKIPLTKEINLMESYITLEKLRYGDRLDLSVTITGDVEKYQIAPFLLLPFLENAFKYGTSKQLDQCWISLNILVEDSIMYFKLVNSIEPDKDEKQIKIGGFGLLNVNKRLALLYSDKHRFTTKKLEEVFIVDLEIILEQLEDKYAEMEMYHSG
jgi:sensor histidine kinase YesM